MRMPDIWEGQVGKRAKIGETLIFPGKLGVLVPILPWNVRSPYFTHS